MLFLKALCPVLLDTAKSGDVVEMWDNTTMSNQRVCLFECVRSGTVKGVGYHYWTWEPVAKKVVRY